MIVFVYEKCIFYHYTSINIYIYIYINRDLMWENMRFCHDDSLFPLVHCFKTRHQLKYNDSLSSLVHCFKTFPYFPHKIKQTVWVLSCYTSHALYIPSHILSCHLILNTLNYPNQEGCRPLDSTCQLHLFSRLIFFTLQLSPSLNAEC